MANNNDQGGNQIVNRPHNSLQEGGQSPRELE